MNNEIIGKVEGVLARAPQWVRQDLLSIDASIRTRAEEVLAAMIAEAIAASGTVAQADGDHAEG